MFSSRAARSLYYCVAIELLLSVYFGSGVSFYYFHEDRHLSLAQIATTGIVYAVAKAVVNIPGGYLARRFGITRIIVLGAGLQAAQSLMLFVVSGPWQFYMLFATTGIAWGLLDQTTFTVMQTVEDGRWRNEYKNWLLYCTPIVRVAPALIGGYAAIRWGRSTPFELQTAVNMAMVGVSVLLYRDLRHDIEPQATKGFVESVWAAIRTMLWGTKGIGQLLVTYSITTTALGFGLLCVQPQLTALHVTPLGSGCLFAGRAMFTLLLTALGHRHIMSWGIIKTQAYVMAILAMTMVLGGLPLGWFSAITLLLGTAWVDNFAGWAKMGFQNQLLSAEDTSNRNLELSVGSAVQGFFSMAVAPFLGGMSSPTELRGTLLLLAACVAVCGSTVLFFLQRKLKK